MYICNFFNKILIEKGYARAYLRYPFAYSSEFEKTDFGFPVAVEDPTSNFNEMDIFPNPNIGDFTFTFSLKNDKKELPVYIINSLGEKIWSTTLIGRKGFNAYNIDLPKLITGTYQLISGSGDDIQSTSIHIK